MFEKIGEKLSAMVAIPTVSGNRNRTDYHIGEYREYLQTAFPCLFAAAVPTPVGEALLLKIEGRGEKKLPVLFTGHMDVVPADDASAWRYPPFSGKIVDGCVWGRGSQDMKGPQCALLSAFDELLQEGWRPGRDIWIYLSCDEETGGDTTIRAAALLKEKNIRFETVFDEGGTICEDFMGLLKGKAALFGLSEKGSLEYRFTANSEGGHSANPPATAALVRLADFIPEVEHTEMFCRVRCEGTRAMLRGIAAYSHGEKKEKLLRASEETDDYQTLFELCPEARTLLGATIAFTMVEGGTAFNVMPKKAVLTANVRVASVETEGEITAKLKEIAERHDLICELAGGRDAAPESRADSEGYRNMSESVKEIYPGLPIIPFVLGGGTDSRHFQELTDNVLRFSPMYAAPEQGRGVHADNESADIQAVADAAACYYSLLKKY